MFFVAVPNFKFDAIKKVPDVLKVVLVQPKKPEPVAEVIEPIKPEPIKPKEIQPEPIKPEPVKKIIEPKPTQKVEPAKLVAAPEAKPETVLPEPQVPVVIAATPKTEEKPVFVAPTPQPEPQKNIGTSDEEISSARDSYKQKVLDELIRNHRYPNIARQRGVQGEVKVKITLDKEGNVTDVSVEESSGNSMLDDGAIATVKRSNLKRLYPEILRGRDYYFTTSIKFTLE